MFNPVYPFTKEVLYANVKRGCTYFVRNTYKRAFDHFDENIKGYFIFTHYNDHSKALAHYNSISNDAARFLYDWNIPEHQDKLKVATSGLKEYKIFSTFFYPDFKKRITPILKEKINRYVYKHTDWRPEKNNTINVDFDMQFGTLFCTLSFRGQQLKINFDEIEMLS